MEMGGDVLTLLQTQSKCCVCVRARDVKGYTASGQVDPRVTKPYHDPTISRAATPTSYPRSMLQSTEYRGLSGHRVSTLPFHNPCVKKPSLGFDSAGLSHTPSVLDMMRYATAYAALFLSLTSTLPFTQQLVQHIASHTPTCRLPEKSIA